MQSAEKQEATNPLVNLRNLVQQDLTKVDELIYSLIANKIDLIPQISEHTISSGGKRLRPTLTLATAQLCNYQGTAHIDLAACVEFMHTATLLHDDVVDKSDLRRGESTANSLWGNKESILVGDYLLGKSFELMGSAQSLEIYQILSNAAVIISEGEVMQLSASGDINCSQDNYIKIISAKTAELFAASCQVSGVLANVSDEEKQALRQFGLNLGIAFQIVDDLLDYYSSKDAMGKNAGDDFKERKITLPVIIAYQNATDTEKQFWQRTINEGDINDSDLEQALVYMNKYDVYDNVMQTANEYVSIAKDSMETFKYSPIREALLAVLSFAVERDF